jgi:hypothetical protein
LYPSRKYASAGHILSLLGCFSFFGTAPCLALLLLLMMMMMLGLVACSGSTRDGRLNSSSDSDMPAVAETAP